jgi:hypothetical protein
MRAAVVTGTPQRIGGDLVKSPSIFLRSLRVVRDYAAVGACSEPARKRVFARTRIAGEAELVLSLKPVPPPPPADSGRDRPQGIQ